MTKRIAFVKNNVVTALFDYEDNLAELFLDSSVLKVDLGIVSPVNLSDTGPYKNQTFSGRNIHAGYIYNPESNSFSKP
jgi:hypothetical protein